MSRISRKDGHLRRHRRVRRKVSGTAERPRMAIVKSNENLSVQFIDDVNAVTMASATTMGTDLGKNMAGAQAVGQRAAEAAREKGIRRVVVDRGGYPFHGRVKAIVEAVEAGGVMTRNQAAPADREEK